MGEVETFGQREQLWLSDSLAGGGTWVDVWKLALWLEWGSPQPLFTSWWFPPKVPKRGGLEARRGLDGKGLRAGVVQWVVGSQADLGAGKPLTSCTRA